MTTFDKREGAFENKFAHDKEVAFKVHARRNKLIAQWAASQMHYNSERTEQYIEIMLETVIKENDDDDVIARLQADFKVAGIAMEEVSLRKQLLLAGQQAQTEILSMINK